jgi:uncharacterized OsmC-like protein
MDRDGFTIDIRRIDGYRFEVDFGMEGVPALVIDEPAPLGEGTGPNPSRLLAAAVAGCLSASLLFCAEKARVDTRALRTSVRTEMVRNDRGRLRIGKIDVEIEVDPADPQAKGIDRCVKIFKDYCVVTESVRDGIPVDVSVRSAGPARAAP